MIYEYLFFAMWFLLSLDMLLKAIQERREHGGDKAYSVMLGLAVIFAPLVLVLSIMIVSFEIFKPEQK
jgi:hypothetical protein